MKNTNDKNEYIKKWMIESDLLNSKYLLVGMPPTSIKLKYPIIKRAPKKNGCFLMFEID
jgi:hypothetical protein